MMVTLDDSAWEELDDLVNKIGSNKVKKSHI